MNKINFHLAMLLLLSLMLVSCNSGGSKSGGNGQQPQPATSNSSEASQSTSSTINNTNSNGISSGSQVPATSNPTSTSTQPTSNITNSPSNSVGPTVASFNTTNEDVLKFNFKSSQASFNAKSLLQFSNGKYNLKIASKTANSIVIKWNSSNEIYINDILVSTMSKDLSDLVLNAQNSATLVTEATVTVEKSTSSGGFTSKDLNNSDNSLEVNSDL